MVAIFRLEYLATSRSDNQFTTTANAHEVANKLTEVIDERPEIEDIVAVVARVFNVDPRDITMKNRGRQVQNIPRQVGIYCSQRLAGYTQKQVAEYVSLSHRGDVSSAVKVIGHRL